mgnify:CR=1 FL=1
MKYLFWKILGIFMIFWFVWYFTGGPIRANKNNKEEDSKYKSEINITNKIETNSE